MVNNVTTPLLHTKFLIPTMRKNQVSRMELVDKINRICDKKLVLITAPAGFGKTSLLAEWCTQTDTSCKAASNYRFIDTLAYTFRNASQAIDRRKHKKGGHL